MKPSISLSKKTLLSKSISSVILATAVAVTPVISAELEEIVVTANKREQSLIDVSSSVLAVSGDTVDEYNVLDFQELESVTTGLFLVPQSASRQTFSIRGLRVDPQSGTQSAVDLYLNNATVNADIAFSQLYDLSRVEVLRGPQGSFQGRTAPAGSVQIHTKDPIINEVGGYIQAQFGTLSSSNIQASVNLPLVKDKLALRVAGNSDRNDGDGVRNIITGNIQDQSSHAYRLALGWSPTDDFNAVLKYDSIRREALDSPPLAGSRATLTSAAGEVAPPNGPIPCAFAAANPRATEALVSCTTLTAEDRVSLAASDSKTNVEADIFNLKADWSFSGQKLSYLFSSWESRRIANVETNTSSNLELQNALITLNPLAGLSFNNNFATVQSSDVATENIVHELRLQSDNDSKLQYTLGFYLENQDVATTFTAPVSSARFLPFDAVFPPQFLTVPIPANPNFNLPAYDLTLTGGAIVGANFTTLVDVPVELDTSAVFAHFSYDLSDKLTVEAAIRYQSLTQFRRSDLSFGEFIQQNLIDVQGLTFTTDTPLPDAVTVPTADAVASGFVGGFLGDVEAGSNIQSIPDEFDTVTDDVLTGLVAANYSINDNTSIYASWNRAYRIGGVSIVPESFVLPTEFLVYDPETSDSFEVGIKTKFWNDRASVNATFFYQTLEDHFGRVTDLVANLDNLPNALPNQTGLEPLAGGITFNGDATTTGIEIESNFLITDNWLVGAGLTALSAEFDDAQAPCNDREADEFIGLCDVSGNRVTGEPQFSFNINSEYNFALTSSMNAYIRGTYKYKGDIISTAALTTANPEPREVDGYGLLNLFVGITSADGTWDVNLWSKNLADEQTNIDFRNLGQGSDSFDAAGHFQEILQVQQRTFGITGRYNF